MHSRVPACMTSPRTKLVSDRYWWSLVLNNGTPKRPWPTLSLCVLRQRCSEPKTWWTGAWRPPSQASASPWRAGMRSSTVIRNRWMQGEEKRQCQTSICTLRRSLRRAWLEVCRWITYLAGSSSSRELRAGGTGPTLIVLPWLHTALKTVRKRASASVKIQTIGLSPSVRSEIRMIVVRAYEGAHDVGDKLRHGIQLSPVPRVELN